MTIVPFHTCHATTVAIAGQAVMIEGPSGAGKSDLALRLIDRGAVLVSDDRTTLVRSGDRLLASPPPTIAGLIEVRGVGIVPVPYVADVPVALRVRLVDEEERLPDPPEYFGEYPDEDGIAGVPIAAMALDPRPASAAIKVELALRHGVGVVPLPALPSSVQAVA